MTEIQKVWILACSKKERMKEDMSKEEKKKKSEERNIEERENFVC